MSAAPNRSPVERFALLIDLLCRATAARSAGGRLAAPFIVLIWTRLRRLDDRFRRLVARIAAGVPPAPPRRRVATGRPPPLRLPRGFAWLVRLVPEAASGAGQLQHLLAEPEMAALLGADRRMGRVLRPLCRMLGLRPPPALALPPRPVAPSANTSADTPATPSVRPCGTAPPAATPVPAPRAGPPACGPPVPA